MNFGLSEEISQDVLSQSFIITDISGKLNDFFADKHYGSGIDIFTIGVICTDKTCCEFFSKRKKYNKKKHLVEYDVVFDHDVLLRGNKNEIFDKLLNLIIESMEILSDFRVNDFDVESFKKDLSKFKECSACLFVEPLA